MHTIMATKNGSLLILPGTKQVPSTAPKGVKSMMETLIITPGAIEKWKKPSFQRQFKLSKKVEALVEELKAQGDTVAIPGIITLGTLDSEKYLLDGQHRIEAFKLAGVKEGLADVRICHFDSMAEMGDEFVKLNSALVKMNPDDILRGLEASIDGLRFIRKKCPFVGYGYLRTTATGPIVSMSAILRIWFGSAPEVPTAGGFSSQEIVKTLTTDEAEQLCEFLNVCFDAWGRDDEYRRLWTALNMTLCAWLWRRSVIAQYSPRTVRLTKEMFRKCLMALSANEKYTDWLLGRHLGERDRSPCYARMRSVFGMRLQEEGHNKPQFPSPEWFTYGGGKKAV
jgi:hypothetical protein